MLWSKRMEKITEEKCINLLKEKFPKFIPYWEAEIALWGDRGMMAQMLPFSKYAIDVIKSNNTIEIKNIFDLVEFLLCNANQSVQNGVATVFLEYLLAKDPDEIKFRNFHQYLGIKSIDYCRVWDKFTGVKTDGLWDDLDFEQFSKGLTDVSF